VAADVFGQGVQRKIRTVFDRPLKHGAEERIVARDDWRRPWARPIVSATRRIIATSTRPLVGLAGVSMKIIATRPLRIASSAARLTADSSTPSEKPTEPGAAHLQVSLQKGFLCRHKAVEWRMTSPGRTKARIVVAMADMPDENNAHLSVHS